MSKKNLTFLVLIVIFSVFLRLWYIDKPQGLWNDEYISWFIASQKFPDEFFDAIIKNCHMPFYYFYLKLWSILFSDSDLSLRLSSLLPGVLSVISMFFVGKVYKDEKTGLLCALITAISGFLIYFSQEVRFYILLFFFSSLNLLCWILINKKQSFVNFLFFTLMNLLILVTHTIGFVFVFFNLIFLAFFLRSKDLRNRKFVKIISLFLFFVVLILSPFILQVFKESYVSQFWSAFSVSKLFFIITDYFSPVQINIVTTPNNLEDILFKNNHLNIMFVIFAMIPTVLALIGFINSFRIKDKLLYYLFFPSLCYFMILVLASVLGKLVLITKYAIEIYPILLLLITVGFLAIKNEKLKKILISLYLFISLFYIIVNNNSAPKLGRSEGNKQIADLITVSKLSNKDIILLTYYSSDKVLKYMNITDYPRFYYIDKYNFTKYFPLDNLSYKEVIQNGKYILFENFKINDSRYFNKKFYFDYIKTLKKGDKLAIIFLKNVCFISKDKMMEMELESDAYKQTSLVFLIFSYIKNNAIDLAARHLKFVSATESGDWFIIVFEKQ